ncbi:MAG: hypothetical protein ACFB0D_18135 [Phormidesmis sp.]
MQYFRWLSVVVREASPQALVKTQPETICYADTSLTSNLGDRLLFI